MATTLSPHRRLPAHRLRRPAFQGVPRELRHDHVLQHAVSLFVSFTPHAQPRLAGWPQISWPGFFMRQLLWPPALAAAAGGPHVAELRMRSYEPIALTYERRWPSSWPIGGCARLLGLAPGVDGPLDHEGQKGLPAHRRPGAVRSGGAPPRGPPVPATESVGERVARIIRSLPK